MNTHTKRPYQHQRKTRIDGEEGYLTGNLFTLKMKARLEDIHVEFMGIIFYSRPTYLVSMKLK